MTQNHPLILESRIGGAAPDFGDFLNIWLEDGAGLGGFLARYKVAAGLVLRIHLRRATICPDIQICFPDHDIYPNRIRIGDSNDIFEYNRDMQRRFGPETPRDLALPSSQAARLLESSQVRDTALANRALALVKLGGGPRPNKYGILRIALTHDFMRALPDDANPRASLAHLPVSCPGWLNMSAHERLRGSRIFPEQFALLDRLDQLTRRNGCAAIHSWR